MLLRLVWRHLTAHWIRSGLTIGSVGVAVCLLSVLRAGLTGLESAVTNASANRLWVQSAVSLFVELPLAYEAKIDNIGGTDSVCKFQWFGGVYQDPSNFFAQFGVDHDTFKDCYPEIEIIDGSYEAFTQNRRGCVVGTALVDKYGWSVGDTVPIIGTIFPRLDGSPWEFEIEAVYRSKSTALDQSTLFFEFDYLKEALEGGSAGGPEGVGVFLVKVSDGVDPTQVMADVDVMFENGPQRVQTTTEAEFSRQFVSMLGNVPALLSAIGGAVLFAIFFAVLNTMLAAGRERIRTVGIVKAIGFTDGFVFGTLVLESVIICLAGGIVGVGIAWMFEAPLSALFAGTIQSFEIGLEGGAIGLGLAVLIGVVAGLAPGLTAGRMTPVRALRAEG